MIGEIYSFFIDPPPVTMIPLLVIGLGLLFWDVRRNKGSRQLADDSSLGAAAPRIQPSPMPEVITYGEAGLFVGAMIVETQKLEDDQILHIVVRGFNASGFDIENDTTNGAVIFVSHPRDGSSDRIPLPIPRLAVELGAQGPIKNLSEFQFVLEQRIPKAILALLIESANEKNAEFDFGQLQFCVRGGSIRMRVPLWSGVTIKKPWDRYSTGRIITAHFIAAI